MIYIKYFCRLQPEHANKVTEMFRSANKVTRLDKALILSFIAGQTENPRPNPENVVTITLNQSKVCFVVGWKLAFLRNANN